MLQCPVHELFLNLPNGRQLCWPCEGSAASLKVNLNRLISRLNQGNLCGFDLFYYKPSFLSDVLTFLCHGLLPKLSLSTFEETLLCYVFPDVSNSRMYPPDKVGGRGV